MDKQTQIEAVNSVQNTSNAIIKRGVKATHYFDYCDEVDCDVWASCTA